MGRGAWPRAQVNPATSFARSYGGLPSLVAATSLLSLFPQGLYNLAQAVLVPFLVDKESIGAPGLAAVRSMMVMDPPPAYRVPYPTPAPRSTRHHGPAQMLVSASRSRHGLTACPRHGCKALHGGAAGEGPAWVERTDARLWGRAQPERGFVDAGGGAPAAQSAAAGGGFYAPAATASWRLRLLRTADMSDAAIASIRRVGMGRDKVTPMIS